MADKQTVQVNQQLHSNVNVFWALDFLFVKEKHDLMRFIGRAYKERGLYFSK